MDATLLTQRLRSLGRRVRAVSAAAGLGWGVVVACALVAVAVWFDLLWELPPGLRLAAVAVAVIAAGLVLAVAVRAARRRAAPVAVARALDDAGGAGGRIRSGVDLLLAEPPTAPLTAGLAALAVGDAGRLAGAVPAARVAPLRPAAWAAGGVAVPAALAVGVALVAPRLAEAAWLRFADPFADHPPYSRVAYRVEPGDARVVYGHPLDVRVTTDGPPVDRLTLVLEPADGSGAEAVPMFAEPGGAWRATVARVTVPVRYHVRSHAGRSRRFAVEVLTVPRLEGVRVRVTPPAYTNRPATDGPIPAEGLAGLPGTRVEVWATSNRPLAGGSLRFTPPAGPVSLAPTSPGSAEVTGAFEVRTAGQFRLTVSDPDGQESEDAVTAAVTVLTDERPQVRLLEPREVSLATPTATLPVTVAAEDDYGLSRVQLFRSLNDSQALPLDLPVRMPAPTRLTETVPLPLAGYGLQPGDEIKLFARAEDTDPAGPKGAESAVAVVRIVSQEEFERLVRAREGLDVLQAKYQQARRRAEGLAAEADELRKKVKDQPDAAASADDRAGLKRLADRLRVEAAAVRAAAQKPLGFDLDRHLTPQLERLSRQLEQSAKELEEALRDERLTRQAMDRALDRLGEQLGREKQRLDAEAVEPVEHLGRVMPLLEDAAEFVALARQQRELATRLQPLKGTEPPADPAVRTRLRDLQTEQEQLRTALAKLLDDIEEHVTRLADDPSLEELKRSATEFVEAVRAGGAMDEMASAAAGLAESSGGRGHRHADRAAELLEKLIDKAQGGGGLAGRGMRALRFQPTLSDGLGNTVEQLLAEAGLMPGEGDGVAGRSGSGASARRSTASNIGLYGGLPGVGESRGGDARSAAGGTGAGRGGAAGGQAGGPAAARGGAPPTAGGTGEAAVPAPYRRRVAEYFQRVADETGK